VALRVVRRVILSVVLLVYLVPIAWMYSSSMRTNGEIILNPLGLPTRLDFSNFVLAWEMADMGRHFVISITITALSTLLVVGCASLAAYGFSRLNFAGRKPLYAFFLFGLILPSQSFLVGLFILFREVGLLNTLWSVILPVSAIAMPLAILLTKNYFDSLPSSIEESAQIEGASTFTIFHAIILPLATPILATVTTFTIINVWNEFMIPFVMIQTTELRPLTTSLYVFSTRYSANYALRLAALAVIATPMFGVYIVLQSQIQKGITAGAVKA
jgi:raffinose/stachyose/melibiose transport system permease protein